MFENNITSLVEKKVCWLDSCGKRPGNDEEETLFKNIVISSRIRLARNRKESYFPARADDPALIEIRENCIKSVQYAMQELGNFCQTFFMDLLPASEREFLLERHYISKEFLNPRPGAALLADGDNGIFIMVNEEDHLRIQMLEAGMDLKGLWQKISLLDDRISVRFPYAFDPEKGYLTSCPSNMGSGMRASCMLHLPALALSGQISSVANALKCLGFTIRGFYGEGSSVEGNFYQISNQSTLGEPESKLLCRLENIVARLCEYEIKSRHYLLEQKRDLLLNFIGRSYALAKYSYSLKTRDALNALSGILLGIHMGMFPSLSACTVKPLLLLIQDSHLQFRMKKTLSCEEKESARATLLRDFFRSSAGKEKSGDPQNPER